MERVLEKSLKTVNSWGRVVRVVLFLLALSLGRATPVSAHAGLIRSDPVDNAILATAPPKIHLWFNEPVIGEVSSAMLLTPDGQLTPLVAEIDHEQANHLSFLLSDLVEGVYTVHWKSVSRADGHSGDGILVFTVGGGKSGSMDPATGPVKQMQIPWSAIFLRWAFYITLVVSAGAAIVARLVLNTDHMGPEMTTAVDQVRQRVVVWGALLSILAVVAGLGLVAWEVKAISTTSDSFTSLMKTTGFFISRTTWGKLWLAREIMLGLLSAIYLIAHRAAPGGKRLNPLLNAAIVLSAIILTTQAGVSHAAALREFSGWAIAADAWHLFAVQRLVRRFGQPLGWLRFSF